MPALLTRMSSRPKCATVAATVASIEACSVMSSLTPRAFGPRAEATAFAPGSLRSAMTTLAPSLTQRSAIALPMPRAAPVMMATLSVIFMSASLLASPARVSRRGDFAVDVPQVFPAQPVLPEENRPLDQTAVAVDAGDRLHLLVAQRVLGGGAQIGGVVARVHRERDRRLAALHRPLDADGRRMDPMALGDSDEDRVLHRRGVLGGAVALGAAWGTERTIADRLHAVLNHEAEQLRLLEMGVKLHFVDRRPDPRVAQDELQLRSGHVGRADVPDELPVH